MANVDVPKVVSMTASSMIDNISTSKIDELTADACVSLLTEHPEYGILAARILVSNWHKNTSDDILETFEQLGAILSPEFMDLVRTHRAEYQSMIDYRRDYDFDYFAIKTLEKIYCGRVGGVLVERPQHVYLRVAIALHGADFKKVKETYALMSKKKMTHASPTLFNAGLQVQQLASCYLTHVGDSLDEICDAWKDIAHISKLGGGIGSHVHAVRSKGAPITSTNGTSDGIIPMLHVMNSVVSYVNQCFVPDTLVYTASGQKEIEDIRVGDEVLTKDGTFRGVREVFSRRVENENMVVIQTESGGRNRVICTAVHDIYALKKNTDAPNFYPAGELEAGDYTAFPIPQDVHPDAAVLTLQACYRRGKEFGKGFGTPLEPVYTALPRDCALEFLRGVVEVCEITSGGNESYVAFLAAPHVLHVVTYMCLRLGVLTMCGPICPNEIRIPNHPDVRGIAPFKPYDWFPFYQKDGMLWTKIAYIGQKEYTGDVYDLSVHENHNYTVECGLVHNSGRRKGSMAVYLSPHHPDVMDFLELRRPGGDEAARCRDLFLAMWIPDLFMKRVEDDASWSFFDPFLTPGLDDAFGEEYDALYERYEAEGKAVTTVNARDVWNGILRSQIETGTPYMLYKDACNGKSNQQNLGVIKCSNLCVAPETLVLTKEFGHVRIQDVSGQNVHVWNGEDWSKVEIVKTSAYSELLRVVLSDGSSLECTPYHTFHLDGGSDPKEARELVAGDVLEAWDPPVVTTFSDSDLSGTIPPVFDALPGRVEWMAMLLITSGSAAGSNVHIDLDNGHAILRDVQLMLLTMGVRAVLEPGILPTHHRLVIDARGMRRLEELGCKGPRLDATRNPEPRGVRVVKVERTGRMDATYCFNEPVRHRGVFNGILTGNCSEIIEYTSPEETAVCNLASISLPAFVKSDGTFDFLDLGRVTKVAARNLDRVIDLNVYPIPQAKVSNLRHRPVGIGVQGLADVYVSLRLPFDSAEAAALNVRIFATMYHAALDASADLAMDHGTYDSYEGSPASRGLLQYDLWGVDPDPGLDWGGLKRKIAKHGLRNSLSIAVMPTASTAQVFGNNESIEPFTSLLYTRRTLAGEFVVMNKHLVDDLVRLGLWTPELKDEIIANGGSVQTIHRIPADVRELYKTAWDVSQKAVIDQAADRGPYVCQSQSLNLFVADPTYAKLTSMHFYGWRRGLKTGMYYLRSKAASSAKKITLAPSAECLMCSS